MAGRRSRQLVLVLSADEFDELDRRAKLAERDAWQQARWYVLRALDRSDDPIEDDPFDSSASQTRSGQAQRATSRAS